MIETVCFLRQSVFSEPVAESAVRRKAGVVSYEKSRPGTLQVPQMPFDRGNRLCVQLHRTLYALLRRKT
jgi:hypothetical protein